MIDAIEQSCDVYLYELAKRVGIKRIGEMAARFGFGEVFNFGLPGENRGLIPTPAWKRKTFGQAWHAGETLITSIGQGFILCTPLQLAVMTSRLVNGGRLVFPRLVKNERAEIQKMKSLQLIFLRLRINLLKNLYLKNYQIQISNLLFISPLCFCLIENY